MNRSDFLKLIGGRRTSFLFRDFGTKDLQHALQEITIYDNYVRGANFYHKDYDKLKPVLRKTLNYIGNRTICHFPPYPRKDRQCNGPILKWAFVIN